MANRVTPLTQIETLSGNISAATYFDNNLGPAFTALNDPSLGYVNGVLTDTGSANNYVVTVNFGTATAYNQGMTVVFKAANTNTGASTITVSPLASVSIVNQFGNALVGGEIPAGANITLVYNGTAFVLTVDANQAFFNSSVWTVNQTLTLTGAGSIVISSQFNTTTSFVLTLNSVPYGIPYSIYIQNVSGATRIFSISFNLSNGNNPQMLHTIWSKVSGAFTSPNLQTIGISLISGGFLEINGIVPNVTGAISLGMGFTT